MFCSKARKNNYNPSRLKRYREIISVFLKNGLGFPLAKITLSRDPQAQLSTPAMAAQARSLGIKLREAFEELGPTFVKLGQILSTRTDIIPDAMAQELQKLQDNVPPFSFDEAKELIEEELGEPLLSAYKTFEPEPIAAASVSQVYRAVMHSGNTVAVKVQRPGVLVNIEQDMSILLQIARFADRHTKYGKMYDFEPMVVQLKQVMEQEMDFVHEGENIDRFRHDFSKQQNVTAPKVYWIYTTKRVLTMDFVDGIKIDNVHELEEIGADRRALARTFVDSLIRQMLVDGFFHADPHPGNVMVTDHGKHIEFIDMGMAASLSVRFRRQLTRLMVGVATQNTRKISEAILDMDTSGTSVNLYRFHRALDVLLDNYLYTSVEKVNIAGVFQSVFSLAGDFKLKIAGEFALVAKSLGTAQIIIEKLMPNTSMLALVEDTAKDVLSGQNEREALKSDIRTRVTDLLELSKSIPSFMLNLIRKTEENDFALQINIKHLEELDKSLERISSRISFTVILLGLCILMAGVIVAIGMQAQTSDRRLIDISLFALRAGLVIAGAISGGLLFNVIYTNINKNR